jgi:alpha/beta superfamily hydrolase
MQEKSNSGAWIVNSESKKCDGATGVLARPRCCRSTPSVALHFIDGNTLLYSDLVLHETPSIRSFFLDGPAGRLEALLNAGSPNATHAALVCHPHPLFGGTLHNKVVFHAMKALNSFGFPVLRFNFRGTSLSDGEHAHGIGEIDDVRIALDWLAREYTLPIIFAGFSFGAAVGLRAAYNDDRVRALIALGLPAVPIEGRVYEFEFLRTCTKLKLFVSGSRDQFGLPGKLEMLVETFADPKTLVRIEAGDHFFEGRLKEMRETIEAWVREVGLC